MRSPRNGWSRRVGLPMAAYVVVLVASMWLLRSTPPASSWRIPLALAPIVPIVFVVRNGIRATREMDELEQRIALEGAAFAQTTMIVSAIAYGFLQAVGFPAVNAMFLGLGLVALSTIGRRVAAWKYR